MSLLLPCPGCGENRRADEGHAICRQCEGYAPKGPASFTDEDVERVAEAIAEAVRTDAFTTTAIARAALTAYLQPKETP